MSQGNGSTMLGLPDWPGWIRATVFIGAPAAIALYLTYFLAAELKQSVVAQAEALRQHVRDQAILTTHVDTLIREQSRTNQLLVQLCLQGASDPADRRACLDLAR